MQSNTNYCLSTLFFICEIQLLHPCTTIPSANKDWRNEKAICCLPQSYELKGSIKVLWEENLQAFLRLSLCMSKQKGYNDACLAYFTEWLRISTNVH